MKRFLMTSALVLTTATGAAFAQSNDSSSQLRTQVGNWIGGSSYNVDVDSLTDDQIAAMYGAITSSEDQSEQDAAIRSVINAENVEMEERPNYVIVADEQMDRSQLHESVSMALVGTEYEGMAYTLTDEELAAVYGAVTGTDSKSELNLQLSQYFEN